MEETCPFFGKENEPNLLVRFDTGWVGTSSGVCRRRCIFVVFNLKHLHGIEQTKERNKIIGQPCLENVSDETIHEKEPAPFLQPISDLHRITPESLTTSLNLLK